MPLHIEGDANALTDIPSQSFGSVTSWHLQTNNNLQKFVNSTFPLPELNSWTIFQLHPDVAMKGLADAAFYAKPLAVTTKNRQRTWTDWERYVAPLGLDPYLQDMPFPWRVRALTEFTARACKGTFGKGCQVQACTVSGYVSSVGQTIALAIGTNPVKTKNGDKYLMKLQQMLDGWRHEDPPTQKELPVESDVPEYLVNKAGHKAATALDLAIADLMTVAFYYLLCIGEYTVKRNRNKTKRMVQFKMEDITFFKKDNNGHLQCLPHNA